MSPSVDWNSKPVKNTSAAHVRNRTSRPNRPGTRDRRVQRTKASLRDALIGLAREKPYEAIAVKDILDRANVGRSTFYTHFAGKDELLDSGIHEMLASTENRRASDHLVDRILAFSLTLLQHVDQHRRSHPLMTRESRVAMHEHLREVLTERIARDLAAARSAHGSLHVPAALAARHIAATFVLVLEWWVEQDAALTPPEVDARFRALVAPLLGELPPKLP